MPDNWLCPTCRDHGQGETGAERHTRTTSHSTWTGLSDEWLRRELEKEAT